MSTAPAKRCVYFMRNGVECSTPWYSTHERAKRALRVIQRRYGAAILYRD